MLDIKLLRSDPEGLRQAVLSRGERYTEALEATLVLEKETRAVQAELEPLRAKRNQSAEEVGRLKRQGGDVSGVLKEMDTLKTRMKELEERSKDFDGRLQTSLLGLPNVPHPTTPPGKDARDNVVVRSWGEPKIIPQARDHQDVGESLGILDLARASKLSGARFPLLVGAGAQLERALIQFMLDLHTRQHGYTEVFPPFLVTRQTMTGTGQLPKFEDELYATREDDLFLIPTAEVPLTNMFRDETIPETALPRAVCAYTACFRREAGSYGKDTRGLIRHHQFNKIELVRFTRPEESLAELDRLTGHAEEVLRRLGLAYRVVSLCTGDVGFSSAKTFDLEVWMPGDKTGSPGAWREISSCSLFTDFQSRRINIRYQKADGARVLVHTLNGSGVAVGRTMAAILETYQNSDGTVSVPEVLQPYLGMEKITPSKAF